MLWYPYTQMKLVDRLPKMVAGNGVLMQLEDGRTLVDGISSWWAVIHGYNHPRLNNALAAQAGKFAHVMLGGMTHGPALEWAAELVRITPPGLHHVFFSDSGSIGVEVALKMAIQYWKNLGIPGKHKIVSLRNGYHGDTFKAMEVGDDSDFSRAFAAVLHRGYMLDIPTGGFDATPEQVQPAIDQLETLFKENHPHLAAFILEPVVQCAGGFHIYSPLYLQAARALCTQYKVLLVFDEVATGFGRTGKMFAAEHADVTPDMMIVGKALTAGYMGHAATLSTDAVFNSFLGMDDEKALMHGPTFMGNALACAVGLESIKIMEQEHYLDKVARINALIRRELALIHHPGIVDKRALGAIGVLEFKSAALLSGFKSFAMEHGVWLRPIGHTLYLMPPYVITDTELRQVTGVMRRWVEQLP